MTMAHKAKSVRRRGAIWTIILLAIMVLVVILVVVPWVERQHYQLVYPNQIRQYAEEFALDPYLVAAVIHCESGNRADAVSPKGAIGLMQVMPQTGFWIAEKLDVQDFETDMLKQPDLNIRFGCWYLSFLSKRFDSDRRLMLAAYNAGHGKVEQWLADETIVQDGEIKAFPYEETQNYVERVQRAYEKYKKLYPKAL